MNALPQVGKSAVRTCGTCTLCCTLVPVGELEKPGFEKCRHLCSGGCGIYSFRPFSCRTWSCAWLANPEMPDEWRPDRIHVVFDITTDAIKGRNGETGAIKLIQVAQAWVDPQFPDAIRKRPARAVMVQLAEQHQLPTLARCGGYSTFFAPPGMPGNPSAEWVEIPSKIETETAFSKMSNLERLLEMAAQDG